MFFTKVGLVIAWLLFLPSVMALGITTLMVVTGAATPEDDLGRMLLKSQTAYVHGIALGVAFGVAAEISKAVSAMRDAAKGSLPSDQR
jgi:hypothetical protein